MSVLLLFFISVLMKNPLIYDLVFKCYYLSFYSISFRVPKIRPSQGLLGLNISLKFTICSSILRITDILSGILQE